MKKLLSLSILVLLGMAFISFATAQNISGNYDWLGTAIPRGPYVGSLPQPDWLSPSDGLITYRSGAGTAFTYSPYGYDFMQIGTSDPFLAGLTIDESPSVPNQLYIQSGSALTAGGRVTLGQPYVLWAKVANWGAFSLYDYNNLVLSQNYIAPGWYRISGGYSDVMGTHVFRFVSAGQTSNSLSLVVDSGGYLTSYSLTGRVVDQSGNGIAGARVLVTSSDGGRFTSTTNALGYYGINLPSGVYLVTAEIAGYSFTQSVARVVSGIASAAPDVVGYPLQAVGVTGTAGANGTAGTIGTTGTSVTSGAATTGTTMAMGTAVTAGTSANQTYTAPGPQASGLQSYSSTGTLQGRVTDQSGVGIAGAAIFVDGLPAGVVTDASGSYSLVLPPGMHRVEVSKAGWGIPPRVAFVFPGVTTNLVLIAKGTVVLGSGKS